MAETPDLPSSVPELTDALAEVGYLADRGLATSLYLGLRLGRPVLLEGEVGVGKTEVAKAMAVVLGRRLIRLQCYEGIDSSQALYEWDYARQMLQIRAMSERALGRRRRGRAALRSRVPARTTLARRRARRRRCRAAGRRGRPRRRRVRGVPARAALRLPDHHPRDRHRRRPSGRRSWCSPPTAPASCTTPSSAAASTTGSATRAPSARSRSCWSASPASAQALARKVVAAVNRLRALELAKPPGVAETIDWVRSLDVLGADDLDPEVAADTIGAVVKERDDLEQVSGDLARITSGA